MSSRATEQPRGAAGVYGQIDLIPWERFSRSFKEHLV
jgi:hypothetical protein